MGPTLVQVLGRGPSTGMHGIGPLGINGALTWTRCTGIFSCVDGAVADAVNMLQ